MIKRIIVSIGTSILAFAASVTAQAQTYSNAVQALNPVAYWPLTESATPPALYIATNSGTLGAAANGYYETWWQTNGSGVLTNGNSIVHITGAIPGDTDTAMAQGVVGQYVVIPRANNGVANPSVTLTAPFTIEAWIYPTNNSANQLKPILAEGFNNSIDPNLAYSSATRGTALGMYSGFLYFVTFNASGAKAEIDTGTLVLNQWHHIVATFDGTTEILYMDGAKIGSKVPALDAYGNRYAPDMVSPLVIGGGNELGISGGANTLFGGGIDEVAFYNTALTQNQVTNHYWVGTNTARATSYSQTVSGDNPTIYLRLDEPAFTGPTVTSLPVANNYGSLGAAANGFYLPGATLGAAGPAFGGFGSLTNGVALNGFNAGVDVGNGTLPAQLNPSNGEPMTVTAWFKGNPADCVGRFQEIVGHSDSGWRLSLDNNAGSRFNPGNGPELQFSSVRDELANNAYVNDGNWHFIAGVSDGTNDSMYLDGVLVKSGTNEGTVTNGSALDVILGGDPQYLAPQPTPIAGGGRWFDGSLAQVAFFTNALTSSQIVNLYSAAGVPPTIVQQPVSQAVFQGVNASIPAVAHGSATLSYQWYKGSSPASGQTTSALTFSPATSGSAGSYYLVVNNSYGSVTSAVIQVTVSASATTPYNSAVEQLNPVAYWPLNETNQPPAGQYVVTNLGTLGAVANGYYQSWYQPQTIGATNTFYATNNIQHGAGATADGDTALLCGNNLGAGQYVVLPRTTNGVANAASTILAPFSIECWLKPTNFSGLKPIVTEGRNQTMGDASHNYTNDEYGFSFGQYNSIFYFQCYNGTTLGNSGPPELDTAGTLVSNQWTYMVITFDGSTETMYSNGVLVVSKATTYVPDPVSPLIIGSGTDLSAGNGGIEFGGAIDDVAIYNVALSQTQISAHFAATNSGTYAATVLGDSPIIYYRLNEPAFNSYPSPSTYPVAYNYGTLGSAANGAYQPGSTPGAAGPAYTGLGSSPAVAINGFYGGVDIGGGLTPLALNPVGNAPQTVVAWFQANPADARFQEIVSRGDSSWRLAFNGNNGNPSTAPYDNHYNPGNGPELGFTNITDVLANNFRFNDGNWHMVVGVSDGSTASMYLDGQLAKQASGVGSIAGSALDTLIGGSPAHVTPSYNSANIRYFDGQVAQVAYFTNALNAAQVQGLYNAAGVPLMIVQQPQSATFSAGSNATLTVVVRGSTPIYQWYSTNITSGTVSPVAGQTNATLSFNPANLSENGYYFVVATNAYNAVTSDVAQLTIVGPPSVVNTSPNTLHVFVGTTPMLHVSVIAPGPYFQWYSNGVAIAGATNSSFVTNSTYAMTNNDTSSVGTYTYTCVITNSFGSATDTFNVTVLADPTAPYPVKVLADKPIYYYRLNEADTGYPNNGVIAYDYAGGENGSYSNSALAQPGYSSATDPTETSAGFGTGASMDSYMGNVSSYVDFATPTNNSAEFTVECWANASFGQLYDAGIVTIGYGFGGEEFCLDNGGNDPNHAVRFYVNGANGATYGVATSFVLANNPGWHYIAAVCDEAGGKVSLYIDGNFMGSTSIPATAGVRTETSPLAIGSRLSTGTATDYDNQFFGNVDDVALYNYALSAAQIQSHYFSSGVAPLITQVAPQTWTTNVGSTVNFTVTAQGTQPLTYTWYDPSSTVIPGQTNATLTLTNVQTTQSGQYSVAVGNFYGTATTNVNLTVNGGPAVITTDLTPLNQTVYAGSAVTYSITASGTPPFYYRWYQDGTLVSSGATDSSYTFSALLGSHTYYCTVSNAFSGGTPATSSTATVTGMPSTTLNPANYTDRVKITFSGYTGGETLHDFPVMVQLSTNIPGFNYAHFASASGGDLRFTDSGGTRVLPCEIDQWNPNGTSIVWVQMPSLSSSSDYIYAYWGDPSNTTPLPGTNVWVTQPWENLPSYAVVYHLKENGFPYIDSTSQFTSTNGTAPVATNGMIGTAELLGGGQFLDANTINLSNAFTVSAWVNVAPGSSSIQMLWGNSAGGYTTSGFRFYINSWNSNPGDGAVHLEAANGSAGSEVSAPAGSVPAGQWHLVTADIDQINGVARLFVDTNDVTSGGDGIRTDFNTNNDVNLGHLVNDGAFPFNGAIDEARIHFGTNSPAWVAAEYLNVAQNSTFETYAPVSSTIANPVTILFQRSGNNLILTGSGGPANQPYTLLSATNIASPMAQWTPVTTNNFDGSGNFSNGVPIDSTNKSLFFRIAVP